MVGIHSALDKFTAAPSRKTKLLLQHSLIKEIYIETLKLLEIETLRLLEIERVIGKELKDNPRFVITNRKQSPQWLYEKMYCSKGEVENRIKEVLICTSAAPVAGDFWDNQLAYC